MNGKTGELGKYKNAYLKGLEFKIYEPTQAHPEQRIKIEGSIHKYWNNGAHNFNDFGINEIMEVLRNLKNNFKISPENMHLKALEIGVNINPPINTKTLLKQCVMHKTERFKCIATKDEGNYIQAEYQRHIIKIYDKRKHYENKGFKIEKDIFRFEIKYLKMAELKEDHGIETMADLLNFGLLNFKPKISKHWDEVIYSDFKALRGNKYQHLYSNPIFWESLNYDKKRYHKKNLNKINRSQTENIKKEIADLILEKVDFLNIKTPIINPLYIGLKTGVYTPEKKEVNRRICSVTGLNISMQKNDSEMLSHTGLKYYFKTDPKIFKEVSRKYLTANWENENYKTQIKEIAHNIRNYRNNQKLKQERLYPEGIELLFDIQKL
ncbi:MAG: hypothetical protein V7705_13250 [Leeuwenhoekiella marinoflava]